MKDIRAILHLDHNRLLRLGLLLASTLAIVITSALVYAGAVFQKALNVGTATGATGPGSTTSLQVGIPFATVGILVLQVFVISLSVFGFPPKLPKHLGKSLHVRHPLPTTPGSKPSEREEWEESSGKSESGTRAKPDMVGDILETLRKRSATKE
ncbi:MAG TPA: hypothetical protein VNA15_03145 [Candidatus Angelobacter sp.]|nr:hypothetical protein [Candidatus Angelobacter sp.]